MTPNSSPPLARKRYQDRQARFVQEYVYGPHAGNATASYIAAGYSPRTAGTSAHNLLKNPKVAALVLEEQSRLNQQREREGIGRKDERQRHYNDLMARMLIILTERGSDPALRMALGGASGFITRTFKTLPNPDPKKVVAQPLVTLTEEKFDGALWAAYLNLLKQTAIEAGDWDEKRTLKLDSGAFMERARQLAAAAGLDEAEAVAIAQEIVKGTR